jgi:hypothetical protein
MNIQFNYKDFAKDVYQLDGFVEQYSEYPEQLAKIIQELVDVSCFLSYSPAPWDEKGIPRLKSHVELTYKGNMLTFDFWHSMVDSLAFERDELESEFLGHVLYDLLCTIGSDAIFCDDSFKDFCDATGFNPDNRQTRSMYKSGRRFAKDIMGVFERDELACFPS